VEGKACGGRHGEEMRDAGKVRFRLFLHFNTYPYFIFLSSKPVFDYSRSFILLLIFLVGLSFYSYSIKMAPDISQLGDSGFGNLLDPAQGYKIPDITFKDPQNRTLKVLTIGAGVSGIMMAYQIQKQCQKYNPPDLDLNKRLCLDAS